MNLTQLKVAALHADGRTREAITVLDGLVTREDLTTPERQMYAAIRWQVLLEIGDAAAAEKALRQAIAIDPRSEVAEQLRRFSKR